MNNRKKGRNYELKTAEYLQNNSFQILDMNYNCRFGEVDIIAKEQEELVFIEVKYRMNDKYGHPSEAINFYKKRNIINVSRWYIHENKLYETNIRYDVAIWLNGKLEYYKGAFDCDG